MNSKDRKIIYVSVLASILLHVVILILINLESLFGAAETVQPETPEPLELVFEQPQTEKKENLPEKFYELVENPNANTENPEASDMLSTKSSQSQAPVIQPGQLRAVPGEYTKENKQSEKREKQTEPSSEVEKAVKDALLAYRENRSFNRKLLSEEKEKSQETEKDAEQQFGESKQRPEGFDADLVGDFALSTYEWEWAPYWLAFKRKLNRIWYAPPAYYRLGLIHGHTISRIKISRDGRLVDLEVLRHVGHESLQQSSVSALDGVFPFQPLPDHFPEDHLEITIKMIYPDLRQYTKSQ